MEQQRTLFDNLPPNARAARPVREVSDVCQARHRGSKTSIEANEKAAPYKTETCRKILEFGKQCEDFTLKEAAGALNKQVNQISGRFAPLVQAGCLKKVKDEKREGCQVYMFVRGIE